jgi:hypothetical protein
MGCGVAGTGVGWCRGVGLACSGGGAGGRSAPGGVVGAGAVAGLGVGGSPDGCRGQGRLRSLPASPAQAGFAAMEPRDVPRRRTPPEQRRGAPLSQARS